MSATTDKHRPIILTRYAEPSSVFAPQPFPLGSFAVRSLQMAQSGPGGVFFRSLMIIGMIALAGGLSPAQAKHGPCWGHPGKHGWGNPGRHLGWYKHPWKHHGCDSNYPEALISRFWAALLPVAMRTDDKRIVSMLERAREPLMIEAVLAADGFPEAAEWIDQPYLGSGP